MRKHAASEQARRELDRRLRELPGDRLARPHAGWIRAVRDALGMSQAALAGRLGITQGAVAQLEHAEIRDGITIAKLNEVATALDCQLVYALVPTSSLQETVEMRALVAAEQQVGYVSHTMALEGQDIPEDRRRAFVDQLAEELIAQGKVWETPLSRTKPRDKRPDARGT